MSKALKDAIEANDPEAVKKAAKTIKDWSRKLPKAEAPLKYAVERNADAVIDPLLDAGALAWDRGYEGTHPLCIAANKNLAAIVRKIAARGVPEGVLNLALFIGVCYGKTETVQALLETARPTFTQRIVELATWWSDGKILETLLAHGANINQPDNESSDPDDAGQAPIHDAASHAIVRPIELIATHGGNLNARDAYDRTPLMVLAGRFPELEDEERIQAQIAKSTNTLTMVIPVDNSRRTGDRGPSDALAAADTLLKFGADATVKDRFGNDALAYYEFARRLERTGINRKFVELLKKAGAKGSGNTGKLFEALKQDSVADAYNAIDDGANVDHQAPPPWGDTPLVAARSTEMVELLLEKGADPNKHSIKQTPLIVFAQGGNLQAVKLLVKAGADVHAIQPRPPKSEYIANAYSLSKGEVLAYLKSLGAGVPVLPDWEPLKPGVGMWENFSEVVTHADVSATSRAIAKLIAGKITDNAYGKEFKPGKKSFAVLRPKGMAWCNIFQVTPPPQRFQSIDEEFLASLAQEIPAPVLLLEYSDTAGAGSLKRFNPDGSTAKDQSGDEEALGEMVDAMGKDAPAWARDKFKKLKKEKRPELDLQKLGEQEKYAVAWGSLIPEDGKLEIAFTNLPAEAFDPVAWIST